MCDLRRRKGLHAVQGHLARGHPWLKQMLSLQHSLTLVCCTVRSSWCIAHSLGGNGKKLEGEAKLRTGTEFGSVVH